MTLRNGDKAKSLLVQRIVERELRRRSGKYLRGDLVDIGCGTKPYASLVQPFVDTHVGVDQIGTLHDKCNVDVVGSAYEIPAADGAFDSAICTAVLEHLEEPEAALKECLRVLKPGGIAIYSVPFIWHLHEEPRDFYRYTSHGLKYLFEKVGFAIVEIKALSGFWVTFGQLLVYVLYRFHRGPIRWVPIIPLLGLIIQGLAYVLNLVDRAEQWTWMYMVVARKT